MPSATAILRSQRGCPILRIALPARRVLNSFSLQAKRDPEEEKRLNDDAYQDKMAEAIFSGIKKYFAKNPPLAKSTLARLD